MIILPLSYKGKDKKREMIYELFQLAKIIEEETIQTFVVAGMVAFADKVIDNEMAEYMKGWIGMTKVARLFEEEKRKAVKEAVEKTVEEKNSELAELESQMQMNLARQMIEDGEPVEKIYRYAPKAAEAVIRESGMNSIIHSSDSHYCVVKISRRCHRIAVEILPGIGTNHMANYTKYQCVSTLEKRNLTLNGPESLGRQYHNSLEKHLQKMQKNKPEIRKYTMEEI